MTKQESQMTKQKSKKLNVLTKSFPDLKIIHWVNDFGVTCHVFTIQIDSEMQLKKDWQSITNRIAIDFQANFENEYESWNVYVVFLTESEISMDLKYKIENDKYSSRKIVLDEISPPIDEDKIVESISKRIFQLDIGPDAPRKNFQQQDLSQIIDKTLYSHISSINLKDQTDSFLEERKRLFKKIFKEHSDEI